MTGKLTVGRHIDGASWTVTLTAHTAERIVDLIASSGMVRTCISYLLDLPPVSRHHQYARKVLAAHPALHQALTLTLTPGEAAALRDELDDATLEPWSCQYPGCVMLAEDSDFCGRHIMDLTA